MNEPEPDSLIERDARQLSLLDVPEEQVERLEAKGEFTGERLHARDPDRYRAIVAALAEGIGIRAIARAYRVSVNTVRAIRFRESGPIDTDKKEISTRLRQFARMASDRLVEEIDEIPIDKLPLATAIVIDKVQLLDGEATSITGTAGPTVDAAKFNEWIQNLPEAEAVEVPETGLRVGEKLQSGAGLGEPAQLPAGSSLEPVTQGRTDAESVVDWAGKPENKRPN